MPSGLSREPEGGKNDRDAAVESTNPVSVTARVLPLGFGRLDSGHVGNRDMCGQMLTTPRLEMVERDAVCRINRCVPLLLSPLAAVSRAFAACPSTPPLKNVGGPGRDRTAVLNDYPDDFKHAYVAPVPLRQAGSTC